MLALASPALNWRQTLSFMLEGIALIFCISYNYKPAELMCATTQDHFDTEEN